MNIKRAFRVSLNIMMDKNYVYSDDKFTYVNGNRQFIGDSIQAITDLTNEHIIQVNLINDVNNIIKSPNVAGNP